MIGRILDWLGEPAPRLACCAGIVVGVAVCLLILLLCIELVRAQ